MPDPTPKIPTTRLKDTTDLREKFRLAPAPAGVQKVAQLVNGRETASLEEIAKIIKSDVSVTGRLMARAYPRAPARQEATVQMATSRVGINCVIVLFLSDMLVRTVIETFETMASLTLERDDSNVMPMEDNGNLVATVTFTGRATGKVTLAFSNDLSLLIAARLIGDENDAPFSLGGVSDAVGEIANIVAGNLQSRLCDAHLPSQVGLPEVTLETEFPAENIPGASNEHFVFRQGTHGLRVNLSINPFSSA